MAYLLVGLPAAIGVGVLLIKTARLHNTVEVPIKQDDSFRN